MSSKDAFSSLLSGMIGPFASMLPQEMMQQIQDGARMLENDFQERRAKIDTIEKAALETLLQLQQMTQVIKGMADNFGILINQISQQNGGSKFAGTNNTAETIDVKSTSVGDSQNAG